MTVVPYRNAPFHQIVVVIDGTSEIQERNGDNLRILESGQRHALHPLGGEPDHIHCGAILELSGELTDENRERCARTGARPDKVGIVVRYEVKHEEIDGRYCRVGYFITTLAGRKFTADVDNTIRARRPERR